MEKTKWYEEQPGEASSKRISGALLLVIGTGLKLGLFFACIFTNVNNAEMANTITDSFIIAGSTLLGVTVLEVLGKK